MDRVEHEPLSPELARSLRAIAEQVERMAAARVGRLVRVTVLLAEPRVVGAAGDYLIERLGAAHPALVDVAIRVRPGEPRLYEAEFEAVEIAAAGGRG